MKQQDIYLYTDISGNKISVKCYEYGKGKNTLYIQGGVHGGETTYFIFHELHSWLIENENRLQGKIALAPVINPVAWNQRVYYYTVGKFDLYKGSDWNRSYPGGDTTMSARNSKKLFEYFKDFTFAVDLHTARNSKPYVYYMDDSLVPLLKKLGISYNISLNAKNSSNTKFKGTLTEAAYSSGIKSVTIESGSHDEYNQENVAAVVEALKRLIEHLALLPDTERKARTQSQYLVENISVLYSPISGFIKYYVTPQQACKKGDLLAEIFDSSSLGSTKKIEAPFDGVIFELAKTNIAWVGDELFKIIKNEFLKKI